MDDQVNDLVNDRKNVQIIGMGLSQNDLTEHHKSLIEKADLLVGGWRHLEFFHNLEKEKLTISKNIASVVETIKKRMVSDQIVVLASGDPLFFGIGSTLVRELGKDAVTIYPNISSLGAAFSFIKEPWHDAALISLHGRDSRELVSLLKTNSKIGILTDNTRTPGWIARQILNSGISGFRLWVMERLGAKDQIITCHDSMEAMADMEFAMPNVVVLLSSDSSKAKKKSFSHVSFPHMHFLHPPVWPGMPDDMFVHERGLITKSEIRSISISKLRLVSKDHLVWDLGAGSGSVGIEVSHFIPRGRVVAVEKNESRIADILANKERFRVTNLSIVHGNSLDVMDDLPDPDRIFIGGGGKDLVKIVQQAGKRLDQKGVMVINTVLIQNMEPVLAALKNMGFKSELVQVQVSKSKTMPVGERLEAFNPVWVISGERT